MNLSILCVTDGGEHAEPFILSMSALALILDAEIVIGLDGERARNAGFGEWVKNTIVLPPHDVPLQEMVSDIAVGACSGDYVLRLDDDEKVSPALRKWLMKGQFTETTYSFPRVYMYPDKRHILSNEGIYPDLQTRLGRKDMMMGVNHIHAGNPNGAGQIMPFAIEHHKLIVKSYEQRKAIAERYEAIRPGAGTLPEYARYNLPEMFYSKFEVKEYTDGDYSV